MRQVIILACLVYLGLLPTILAQQDSTCSVSKPCKSGCCSKEGHCGFGPDYCGNGCLNNCNAKAECGQYAKDGNFDCPLKVCCSKYGFCGTTSEFCTDCQNKDGCPAISPPKTCAESANAAGFDVRIGYYNVGGASRNCDAMLPENIAAGALTHVNVAFEFVAEDHTITDTIGDLTARVSRLKKRHPGLRVNIALGGWVFNDPPTQHRFSDMAASDNNRQKFISSLIKYIERYGLDGVDIDWEYPVADDRGGSPKDYDNFVQLCTEIRSAFDRRDPGWQLTLTLPSSYWYLRGFQLKSLQDQVDWFNLMSYDIHGLWDQKNVWTGPYLKGHTNLTEIADGINLLWRNGVKPEKVVMGYGFYGRSFTMTDTSCTTPDGCQFSGPGFAGDCTNEPGILSYAEVMSKKKELSSKVSYDKESTVKWMVYGGNQWISYDDEESFTDKKKFQSKMCLRGLMIWAVDLDTNDFQAMTGLMGEEVMANALIGDSLDPEEQQQLVDDLSAWTGQKCYVATGCVDPNSKSQAASAQCKAGYSAVAIGHAPLQMDSDMGKMSKCDHGEYHNICCATKSTPHNCEWIGERKGLVCDGSCGDSQFELTRDPFEDKEGGICFFGHRSLCCDSTSILQQCKWTSECDWSKSGSLCSDGEVSVAKRYDDQNGDRCPVQTGLGQGGTTGPETHKNFRSFCCPKNDPLEHCLWSNDIHGQAEDDADALPKICYDKTCPKNKLKVTQAEIPSSFDFLTEGNGDTHVCTYYKNYPGTTPFFPLCCDPPSIYNRDWPVEPSYLWSHAYDDDDSEVTWEWANNFGNNDLDKSADDLDDDPGSDPYGFVMLDGPHGSINNGFGTDFTVVEREEPINPKAKRSFVTTNRTTIESTFDHSEEVMRVYCNHPPESPQCRKTFYKGAADTIIRLPLHVGEGPYARIVSMEPETSVTSLPSWVARKRSATNNQNGIYLVKFDYAFNKIQRRDDEQVNMRVDYTNLADYWKDITVAKPDDKKRRSTEQGSSYMSFEEWQDKIDTAKRGSSLDPTRHIPGRPVKMDQVKSSNNDQDSDVTLRKRWFGSFVEWLKRLTTVEKGDEGVLPMSLQKAFTLFSGRLRCANDAGVTITAGLDVTASVAVGMNARYAYYFSGTIVPPAVTDTYAYVQAQPAAYAHVEVNGNAELYYQSETKKLIDTLSYPGLSIKGIAAVGPTFDLWGRIDGRLTVSGNIRAGTNYYMHPIEMYFPNDDKTRDRVSSELASHRMEEGLNPTFEANVEAEVDFNIRLTPEIDMGIKIGGEIGSFKKTLVDAHVAAWANTSLNFNVQASAHGGTSGSGWEYSYTVALLYRVGIACVAEILAYGQWKSGTYYPFDWQRIPITSKTVTSIGDGKSRRSLLDELPMEQPVFSPARISPPSHEGVFPDLDSADHMLMAGNTSLLRRDDKATEFQSWAGFKCNYNAGSACASDSVGQSQGDVNKAKRYPVGRALNLVKRDPGDCRAKLPLLMYDCDLYFQDFTWTGTTGTARTMEGICSNVQKFLVNNGQTNNKWTLTWDSSGQTRRRSKACEGYCTSDNKDIKRDLFNTGGPENIINCDEFPIASTQEGGDFYGPILKKGLDPGKGLVRTCVPSWQNDMQGQCNKLLNKISTNVEYFNDAENPSRETPSNAWKSWDRTTVTTWLSKQGLGGYQRLSSYTDVGNQPTDGLSQAERESPNDLGWFHKRNFTLSLAYPGSIDPSDNADENKKKMKAAAQKWPGGKWTGGTLGSDKFGPPADTVLRDSRNIICAVNTQGQKRFRYDSFNGWCSDGIHKRKIWSGAADYWSYYSCHVDFEGSSNPNRKRDSAPIGTFGGHPVYGIERVHGPGTSFTKKLSPEEVEALGEEASRF